MMFPLLLSFLMSCQERQPTQTGESLPAGRRDYVWTLDTLPTQGALLSGIWGSAPTDVWVISYFALGDENVWHYDGSTWTKINLPVFRPISIWGTAQNDVWIIGSEGDFFHYDGAVWKNQWQLTIPNNLVRLQQIWGVSSTEIYAIGRTYLSGTQYQPLLLRYNGSEWKRIMLPDLKNVGFVAIKQSAREAGHYLITAEIVDDTIQVKNKIYEFWGDNHLKEVVARTGYPMAMSNLAGNAVFSDGKKLLKYNPDQQQLYTWQDFSSSPFSIGTTSGRTDKDVFMTTFQSGLRRETLSHFNGEDVLPLYEAELQVLGHLLFEEEFFAIAWGLPNNAPLVVHGKLQPKQGGNK